MTSRNWQALIALAIGIALSVQIVVVGALTGPLTMLMAAAAAPLAVLLWVSGRLQADVPARAAIGGATIGVVVAVIGHAIVFAIAYALFLGFADAAVPLLDTLRIDPRLTAAAGSPWTILFFVELAVVAPLTEEVGKALGARLFNPTSRKTAFLAGVAAGTGFAIVENVLYASGGVFLGTPWEPIVLLRMVGAAVHPLATGLVVLGWYEWRQRHDVARLASRFLLGAGVHALWNGSMVVLVIVSESLAVGGADALTWTSIVYLAGLGAAVAGALWRVTSLVAGDRPPEPILDLAGGRWLGAWLVLTASFVVPVALLMIAFPEFGG